LPCYREIICSPAAAFDQINGLVIDLDGIVGALANLRPDVAHLVHPAALTRGALDVTRFRK
jgi:hypothetical protein